MAISAQKVNIHRKRKMSLTHFTRWSVGKVQILVRYILWQKKTLFSSVKKAPLHFTPQLLPLIFHFLKKQVFIRSWGGVLFSLIIVSTNYLKLNISLGSASLLYMLGRDPPHTHHYVSRPSGSDTQTWTTAGHSPWLWHCQTANPFDVSIQQKTKVYIRPHTYHCSMMWFYWTNVTMLWGWYFGSHVWPNQDFSAVFSPLDTAPTPSQSCQAGHRGSPCLAWSFLPVTFWNTEELSETSSAAPVALLTSSCPQHRCCGVFKWPLTSYAVISAKVQGCMFSLVSLLPESKPEHLLCLCENFIAFYGNRNHCVVAISSLFWMAHFMPWTEHPYLSSCILPSGFASHCDCTSYLASVQLEQFMLKASQSPMTKSCHFPHYNLPLEQLVMSFCKFR